MQKINYDGKVTSFAKLTMTFFLFVLFKMTGIIVNAEALKVNYLTLTFQVLCTLKSIILRENCVSNLSHMKVNSTLLV